MIRVGNMHMSYRVQRLGWREHTMSVFIVAVLLFWVVVLVLYRIPQFTPSDDATARVSSV